VLGTLALLTLTAGVAAPAAPPSSAARPAAAEAPLDELLALLAARRHGHVSFTEVQQLALLDRPLESSGELFYDAPDRVEKRTLKPKAESLLLEHGTLSVHRGHRSYVVDLGAFPQALPFIESIRATLAGDRAALERYFHLDFQGSLASWSLRLEPADARMAAAVREIRISGERDTVRSVEIRQGDGDRSLLSLGPELAP
jgi:outer membrane lipoprotein carrier protein LolA